MFHHVQKQVVLWNELVRFYMTFVKNDLVFKTKICRVFITALLFIYSLSQMKYNLKRVSNNSLVSCPVSYVPRCMSLLLIYSAINRVCGQKLSLQYRLY